MADLGALVEALFDLLSRGAPSSRTPATVFVDDEWVQGELVHSKDQLRWWVPGTWGEVIVFGPNDGFIDAVEDEAGEDHVVLHFQRADDVLHLAVPRDDLGMVGAVLPLPGWSRES